MAEALQVDFLIAGLSTSAGLPSENWTVGFYETDGVTLKTIWEDADKISISSNPVILDSYGTAKVFADGLYSIVIKDDTGSIIRTIESILFDPTSGTSTFGIDASQFGNGNDADAIQQAIASAVGEDKTIFLIDQEWIIDQNLTVPANINLRFLFGAYATVSLGIDFTLNCPIDAMPYNIFRGTGNVVINTTKNSYVPSIWLQTAIEGNQTLYNTVTIPNILNVNSNTLYISGGLIGIGTITPNYKLDLSGDFRIRDANYLRFGGSGAGDDDVSLRRSAVSTLQLVGTFDLNTNNIINGGNIAGTLTTAAQTNITSLGTLTGLTMGGDINLATNNIINGGNIAGTLTTAAQTNITSLGTLTGLTMGGDINLATNNIINGGNIAGTLTTAAQTNITSLGTLTGLTMGGDINLATNNIINGGNISGTLTTAAQTNITSLGTLTILNVDNLNLNGNTISSTDTNGNIILSPNGTGKTVIYQSQFLDYGDGSEGNFTSSGNFDFDGEHKYQNFTIQAGHTMSVGSLKWGILRVSNDLTIVGDMSGVGAGGSGGTAGPGILPYLAGNGAPGYFTGGSGASGGSGETAQSGDGGDILNQIAQVLRSGGAGVVAIETNGNNGNSANDSDINYFLDKMIGFGWGSGGGGGSGSNDGPGGAGGTGAGSLLIIAKNVIVTGTPSIDFSGSNGENNAGANNSGGGGGGGGGTFILLYRTNSSGSIPTPDISGGLGGDGGATGDGGIGGDGYYLIQQIV